MARNIPFLHDVGQGLSMIIGLPTIATWDKKSRPKKVSRGTFGFNSQTKSLEYWDGSSWWEAPLS